MAPARVTGGGEFAFERRFEELQLSDTVALAWTPGAPGWWYAVEQDGRILRFEEADPANPEVVLDIQDRVERGSETGLLGLAFHPDFASNGAIYDHQMPPLGSHVVDAKGVAKVAAWIRALDGCGR